MTKKKEIKIPVIRVPFIGVPRLKRIFQILNLTYDWGLQPRDFSIVAELYNKNQELIDEGIIDEKDRLYLLLSKDNKNKLGKKYNMSYHAVANTLTKMRKSLYGQALLSDNGLHPTFSKLTTNSDDLVFKMLFYNPKINAKI